MRMENPFAAEETLTIVETRPCMAQFPSTVRAVAIKPDLDDLKAKPRLDDINAVIARLPPDTVELIDIDYDCRLSRLPCLKRQSHIRYAHLGARKLRDYSPLFALTALEQLFLVSASLTSLSSFQNVPLKSVRLIRGKITVLDVSAPSVFLQGCAHLKTLGQVSIDSLILESCRRFDLASLATVRGLRDLHLLAPGPLASVAPLVDCNSLESVVITATPLGKTDFRVLAGMPSLRWLFVGAGDARVAKVAEALPHVMVTNGHACFRADRSLPPEQYYQEMAAAKFH